MADLVHLWNDAATTRPMLRCAATWPAPATYDPAEATCGSCLRVLAIRLASDIGAVQARREALFPEPPTPTDRLVVWPLEIPKAAQTIYRDIGISNTGLLRIALAQPVLIDNITFDGHGAFHSPVAVVESIYFTARVADKDNLRAASNSLVEAFERAKRR